MPAAVVCALLWLMLSCPAPAQSSLPDPACLGQGSSVSITVVRARPDDPGFRQLFRTALAGARSQQGEHSMASALSGILSQESQLSMVQAALPLQFVRVEQAGEDRIRATSAITVTGWRGLQSVVYNTLVTPPDGGKPEVRGHRGEEIVLRPGWRDSRGPRVVARVRGTFLNCSTPDLARQAIDGLLSPPAKRPQGPLWDAYARLNPSRDVYGALLNRNGSLGQMLTWACGDELEPVRRKVGVEQFERVTSSVTTVAWEGEVVSDDRIDLDLSFTTAHPGQVAELSQVWEEICQVLKGKGRLGDYKLVRTPSGAQVHLSLIGFREAVGRFLGTLKL